MQYYWRGAQDGTGDDGRNYVNESGTAYAEAAGPFTVAGRYDELFYDSALGAGNAPSSVLDFHAATEDRCLAIHIGRNCDYQIGTAANPLWCNADKVIIDAPDAGDIFLKGDTDHGGLNGLLLLDGPALGKVLSLDGLVTSPKLFKGRFNVESTCTIATSLETSYVGNPTSDLTGTIEAMATAETIPDSILIGGGTITNNRPVVTLIDLRDGAWTQAAGDVGSCKQYGGSYDWQAGNMTSLYAYAGSFTGENGVAPRRIGNIYAYGDAVVNLDNGLGNILLTGAMETFDAAIDWPNGQSLQQAITEASDLGSRAIQGIAVQTLDTAGTASVFSADIWLNRGDSIDVYALAGPVTNGGGTVTLTVKLRESSSSAHSDEADISGKAVTFVDADDGEMEKMTLWRHDMAAAKSICRVNAVVSGAGTAVVGVLVVKKSR